VWDDGPGLAAGVVKEGIGLSNTRERLRHLYGPGFRMDFGNADGGGFFVLLAFPIRKELSGDETPEDEDEVDGGPEARTPRPGRVPLVYGF
jgi:hypothetical protein